MNNLQVRLAKVALKNFKNVENGHIEILNENKLDEASILGIYGQNGSGKTAIIDALKILHNLLRGSQINKRFAEFININSKFSSFEYQFILNDIENLRIINIYYSFDMAKVEDYSENQLLQDYNNQKKYHIEIQNEKLSFSLASDELKLKKQDLIYTENDELLGPKSKIDSMFNKDKKIFVDLIVAIKVAKAEGRSSIFCKQFLDMFKNNCKEELYLKILNSLSNYGAFNLFVVDTANTSIASLDALVLNFNIKSNFGQIFVPLTGDAVISEEAVAVVEEIINNMNIVLDKLIPGLTIKVINYGKINLDNGKLGCRIQLLSHRNNIDIPLRYESEGTKKIIAILQLLINVYNNPSTTVAIDEIDSGVFELLLGDLLNIISQKGKGQLIFTSHNLRPLEMISKSYLVFTTTNPKNRYIRMTNVKANNNLRRQYFNGSLLSEQEEELYNLTDDDEIKNAFEKAGIS